MLNTKGFELFVKTLVAYAIGLVLMFVIGFFAEKTYVSLPLMWTYAATAYIIFSFRWTQQVQAGFTGVRYRLGEAIDQVGEGLVYAPLFIYTLELLDLKFRQNELPDEPENIWLGDLDSIPEGKKPPVRVSFRDQITEQKARDVFGEDFTVTNHLDKEIDFNADTPEDGLSRRVTVQVTPIIQWRIGNALKFVRTVKSVDEVKRQLEDEIFRIINMQLPKMSYGQALQNVAWINVQILKAAKDRSQDWGVDLKAAFIKGMPLHHGLNDAIGQASEAEFTGRADKELAIKRGEGAAQAAYDLEQKTLAGRGRGLKDAAASSGLTAEAIQAAEVARAIGQSGSAVIVGKEGFGQLAGIAAAVLNSGKDKTDKE